MIAPFEVVAVLEALLSRMSHKSSCSAASSAGVFNGPRLLCQSSSVAAWDNVGGRFTGGGVSGLWSAAQSDPLRGFGACLPALLRERVRLSKWGSAGLRDGALVVATSSRTSS